jgi:WhiB family redox-sensing transcriptional regulator
MRDWILEAIPAWHSKALCAQTDPEAFFPIIGGTARPAKQVCAACPVRQECLEWALEVGDAHGIYGGLTAKERRKYAQERGAAA